MAQQFGNTENQGVTSKRDKVLQRLRDRYPDKNFDEDEDVYGQISDDYDELDGQLKQYKDDADKLSELMTIDPRSGVFLAEWRKTGNPTVAFVKMFGKDMLEELQNPEGQEKFAEAEADYVKRVAKEKELDDLFEKNKEESMAMLDEYQKETGVDDEQIDAAIGALVTIANDAIVGKFSRESVDMALNALNHDRDVAEAGYEGEVRGKNAKIEAKLRKNQQGEGGSVLGGTAKSTDQPKGNSIFALAEQAR